MKRHSIVWNHFKVNSVYVSKIEKISHIVHVFLLLTLNK